MNAAIKEVVSEAAFREERRKYLGGSDIPALLGIAPPTWRRNSPVALYYDKITPPSTEERASTGVKRRGKRWESVVGEMLVEELEAKGHKVEIVKGNERYTDPEYDFFKSEVDFEIRLDGEAEITNVEIKTVHPFKARDWGESETDDAPDYTLAQLAWGLGVTGRKRGIVAPLFGADKLRVFPVAADLELIGALRNRALVFWLDHVQKRVPPGPLFLSDMGLLYPQESTGPALVADEDLTAKLLRMRACDREIKARTAEFEALEFEVKRVMAAAEEILIGDKSAVTWKGRKWTALDQGALKEAHPKIHKEFMRTSTTRAFTLKPFAWE